MSGAQPTATGTLGGTPLANLLVYALDRRLSGTLVIEDPSAQRAALLLSEGAPVKVKLPEPALFLSEVVVEMGALDRARAEEFHAASVAEGKLFGEIMLSRMGAAEASVLGEALAEQVARKVEWLGALPPESVYGYYDTADFLATYGSEGAVVDPLSVIWRIIRKTADPSLIDQTLARLGTRDVRLHPRSRVARFSFDQKERSIVDVLRVRPQSVPNLVSTGILPAEQAKRVLYGLIVTRHVDLGAGVTPLGIEGSGSMRAVGSSSISAPAMAPPAAPAAPKAAPPKPASSPTAASAELRAEIERRNREIGAEDYYQILGVDPTAGTAQIQAAFFQLAKKWHPDRIPPDLSDLKDVAMRIFARMTEAHQTLANDEHRKEYTRLTKDGGASSDEQEEVQRVLRAATAFQKAEVMARKGNLAEAEAQVALAIENDPDQPEYVALFADLQSQKPERMQSGMFQDVVKMVTEAKKRQPNNQRIWLYRARVLKRSGDVNAAYQEYRAIVEKDVNNVEAAREVRLHQMRKGGKTTDPQKKKDTSGKPDKKDDAKGAGKDIGAMFGKLFKR